MRKYLFLWSFCACLASSSMVQAQTPAFPGAEGFGRYAMGGRAGTVYHVTTLADNTQKGSFRYACEKSGYRTVVFDVSGTIHLKSALAINGDITIAGQTAPGDGICVADYPVTLNGNNVIIRYMRFRLGNKYVANHEGDGFGSMDHNNIIIDHCSVSWSIDECLSVYGGQKLTVQWCIASQSLKNAGHSKGAHGYGGNWGGYNASFHHNLIAHNESRTPRLGPRPSTQKYEYMDMRNNVIYNWAGEGCYGGEGMHVNIVNNYYKPGPATIAKVTQTGNDLIGQRIAKIGIRTTSYTKHGTSSANEWDVMWHVWGTFYVDGNYNSRYNEVTNDNWTYGIYNQIKNDESVDYTYTDQVKKDMKLSKPITYESVTTHSAKTAYERVLAYAGASLHRDALDDIIVSDTRNGVATSTGSGNLDGIINTQDDVASVITGSDSPWPTLSSQTALTDTDGDGIPDTWEDSHGLNKNNANDGKTITSSGYTNLEIYLNSLVEDITTAQNTDGTMMSGQEIYEDTDPKEYTLSPTTATVVKDAASPFTFSNGYSISNTSNKTYATGSSCGVDGIKYSAGTPFTIHIPDGISITKVTITGASNYGASQGTCYLAELNGTSYSASDYVFPAKDSGSNAASHDFSFTADPVTGSLTFTPGGVQAIWNITLYGYQATTGLNHPFAPSLPGSFAPAYNLSGQRVGTSTSHSTLHTPHSRIVIQNGRKIIVK